MPRQIEQAISCFSCKRDADLEEFLKSRAIKFEAIAKSRTYFLLDKEALNKQTIEILAYFSIAPQVLYLPENLSGNRRKKLDGFSGKIKGEHIAVLPVILIGQLAKNDAYCKEIGGDVVLKYAFSIIKRIHEMLGGRIVMVDVKEDASGLIRFYERHGFERLSNDLENKLSQMIRMLC